MVIFSHVRSHGQIIFPTEAPRSLPKAEPCEGSLTFCGDDPDKYPLQSIDDILSRTIELQASPETMKRFFSPTINIRSGLSNTIDDLACESRRATVPHMSRAKNVNGKWMYLAQTGNGLVQNVEVFMCSNPGNKCVNDIDSPHGENTTTCKQLFATHKLLALDEQGNVLVDTFDLPAACVCKTKVKGSFSLRSSTSEVLQQQPPASKPKCLGSPATVNLSHRLLGLGRKRNDSAREDPRSARLKAMVRDVTPCKENQLICADDDDQKYPANEIKAVLVRHKTFKSPVYFDKLFGRACEVIEAANGVQTRNGFDLFEEPLCVGAEKYIYPLKAMNVKGQWKFIVNTDEYRQGLSIHTCINDIQGSPCLYAGTEGINPDATECRQMFTKHRMLAIDDENGHVDFDTFKVPSACVCHLLDREIFLRRK